MKEIRNKIIQGDCLEVMKEIPDNSIDCIIFSPPYNKKNVGGKLVAKIKYISHDDNMPEEEYQKWQTIVLDECYRISRVCFYNHKIRYQNNEAIHPMKWILNTKWKLNQEIIWNRKITGNIRGWRCWNIDERVYWLIKEKPKEISQELAQLTSIWEIRPQKRDLHPAPFPIELVERCIKLGTNEGDIILDPMAGSGTTLKMAKKNNRNYIGIEIAPEYIDIINKRLNK